jgi:hypothetical protein
MWNYQGNGNGYWIRSAQDRDHWLSLVNTVMNHRVPQKPGNLASFPRMSAPWNWLNDSSVELTQE